jgi:4-hydroxybenzoate polyprenyltransferase
VELEITSEGIGLCTWARALRLHQWFKNLLLFVPLLTTFSLLDVDRLTALIIAFFAFSLAASATYVVNDLWDLDNDRAHHRKRHRLFASGDIPIAKGLLVEGSALVLAFLMALNVSQDFLFMLLLYLGLTSAYSWFLKGYVLIGFIGREQVSFARVTGVLLISAGAVLVGRS